MKKIGRPKKWTAIQVYREVIFLRRFIDAMTLPTLKEFCSQRHYSAQRWSEWPRNPDFSEALKKEIAEAVAMSKEKFEVMLIKGGLTGKLNKTVVIFALKNVAGWRDVQSPLVINAQSNAVSGMNFTSEKQASEEELKSRIGDNLRLIDKHGLIDLKKILESV
jgi:hypothetical protein